MLKNFLKTTFRNLWKNKSYVAINLLGLSLSLACCIVGYLNFQYAATFDRNHEKIDRIFKIQVQKDVQGRKVNFGISPLPLGNELKEKRTEIQEVSRYTEMWPVIKRDNIVFNEVVGFADPEYFKIFSFPFKYGSEENFSDPSNIILSEETAEKYFGEADPTGELLTLIDDNGTTHTLQVTGVLKKIPRNTSMRFNAIMSFENYLTINDLKNQDWKNFIAATFILSRSPSFPVNVEKWINTSYRDVQNLARDDWKVDHYYLEPFTEFNKNAEYLRSQWLEEPPPKPAIIVPFIMAILMLLIACFNFTNTSIAISSKRLKEIGLRKVMGGNKRQLIVQFMGENAILTLLALLISLGMAWFLVPAYSAMWDFIDLKLSLTENPEIFLFLLILLVFTSAVAGIYPSLYVSSFQPVAILRGTVKIGKTSALSRILLGTQFGLTIIALISSLAFLKNAEYQRELDIGFDKSNVIWVRVSNQSEYERMKNRVDQLKDIEMAAGTEEHIGAWTYGRTLRHGEKALEASMLDLGVDYLKLMDVNLIEGRLWEKDLYEHDKENSILVNEKLVKEMGWENPLGKMLQVDDSTRLSVVGVLKNIHLWGFWDPVEPMGFRPADDKKYNFLVVKTLPGKTLEVKDQLEELWYQVEPNKPFNAGLQDNYLENTLIVNNNIVTMFSFIGLLAMILSVIGMYTLVSLSIIRRVKEIGVRKVLGAQIHQIVTLMNRQFIWILLFAAIFGGVASFFAINSLMASVFAYYLEINLMTILIPVLLLAIVSLGISTGRIFRAAVQNPVNSLRYE